MNQSEFAKLHGVSRKTATMWKDRGWLVFLADGTIDVSASNANLDRYRNTSVVGNKSKVTGNTKQVTTTAPDIEIKEGETPSQAADRVLASGAVSLLSIDGAKCLKENYLALLNRLEYEIKSGSVVDLELAQAILFECARAQRDSWLNWPAKVGPLLAADLDIEADKVTELLTEYVHAHIAELGMPESDFKA